MAVALNERATTSSKNLGGYHTPPRPDPSGAHDFAASTYSRSSICCAGPLEYESHAPKDGESCAREAERHRPGRRPPFPTGASVCTDVALGALRLDERRVARRAVTRMPARRPGSVPGGQVCLRNVNLRGSSLSAVRTDVRPSGCTAGAPLTTNRSGLEFWRGPCA